MHAYMFATAGAQIIEVVDMNEIAAEKQYEFAFLGFPSSPRRDGGADARLRGPAPRLRPLPTGQGRKPLHAATGRPVGRRGRSSQRTGFSACPPNCFRIAESTRFAKSASPRDGRTAGRGPR